MRLFHYGKDGGPDSTVWGFWLIEWKRLFSVALLCFDNGSREAYHSHAFNSVSWVLRGRLDEDVCVARPLGVFHYFLRVYTPSLLPIVTRRSCMHKVTSIGRTWVLTFRGPWARTWREWLPQEQRFVTLTNGRQVVDEIEEEAEAA